MPPSFPLAAAVARNRVEGRESREEQGSRGEEEEGGRGEEAGEKEEESAAPPSPGRRTRWTTPPPSSSSQGGGDATRRRRRPGKPLLRPGLGVRRTSPPEPLHHACAPYAVVNAAARHGTAATSPGLTSSLRRSRRPQPESVGRLS